MHSFPLQPLANTPGLRGLRGNRQSRRLASCLTPVVQIEQIGNNILPLSTTEVPVMSEFASTHAALFDELERQGVFCVDVGRLAQAVLAAQSLIEASAKCAVGPYQRCETCE